MHVYYKILVTCLLLGQFGHNILIVYVTAHHNSVENKFPYHILKEDSF